MLIPGMPHSDSAFQGCSGEDSSIRRTMHCSPTLSSLVINTAPGAHNAWNTTSATPANNPSNPAPAPRRLDSVDTACGCEFFMRPSNKFPPPLAIPKRRPGARP